MGNGEWLPAKGSRILIVVVVVVVVWFAWLFLGGVERGVVLLRLSVCL